jgi:hypothetical protein
MKRATESAPAAAPFRFGTKAETLQALRPMLKEAAVPYALHFTVADWQTRRAQLLKRLRSRFGEQLLAVRSSAREEDGALSSGAGAFLSRLNVDGQDARALGDAIDAVAASLPGDRGDQVLVQPMIGNVAVSGVIMTFDLAHGSPYYVINFDDESGRTDGVTAGNGVHKALLVYRGADRGLVKSPRVTRFLCLARELEELCGCQTLDIEFALDKSGTLHLLQVRRIAAARNWHPVTERRVARQLVHVERFVSERSQPRPGILGGRTILAVMPDWNPAEIIGTTPRPLAASLYRYLVTRSVWRQARASMGYRRLPDEELMVMINHHPYIDVRNSFNSFLPAGLSDAHGTTLVDAWLDRLEAHPELHDRVEFEIALTCRDFCFEEDWRSRYGGLLSGRALEDYRRALTGLTHECLNPGPGGTLSVALGRIGRLEQAQHLRDTTACHAGSFDGLGSAANLLRECRELGTQPFAVVARHAFIAESLLRSAVRRGALGETRLGEFRMTVRTVTGGMLEAYNRVCRGESLRGEFMKTFGHLRPGTYEITSPRYDERNDLFIESLAVLPEGEPRPFRLEAGEHRALGMLLSEAGLDRLDADGLMDYARRAISGREHAKFVFTRNLSDALSGIAAWGEVQGLGRDDMSFVEWPQIVRCLTEPVIDEADRYFLGLSAGARQSFAAAHAFRLSHIVRGIRDIYVATLNRSVPNFVGCGRAAGEVVQLAWDTPASVNLAGRIVCIENADPGFDWIFARGPAGLVTKFGGANSHMAVRCAELSLPAAIGCGEQIYLRVTAAGRAELDCAESILRPQHA